MNEVKTVLVKWKEKLAEEPNTRLQALVSELEEAIGVDEIYENVETEVIETVHLRTMHAAAKPKGTFCPVCRQYVKVYTRALNSAMAEVLLIIRDYFNNVDAMNWLHVEKYMKRIPDIRAALRGDFPKLRHWGLIEQQVGVRGDGSPRVGFYRITQKGEDFIDLKIKVPSHVVLFNKEVLGFSDDEILISQVPNFDYTEMMNTVWTPKEDT